jgi:AAA domain
VSRTPTPAEASARVRPPAAGESAGSPQEAVTTVTSVTSREDGTSECDSSNGCNSLLGGLRDGAWLDSQQFPALTYAIPGLVPEGFTLLVGPPKAGKSWLVLGWLLALAAGGKALSGIECSQSRRVLNCAFEDGDRRMQDRCRTLMACDPIPAPYTYLTRVLPGQLDATLTEYLETYPDTGMIAVDTLGRVMPPAFQGESAYGRDYRVGASLKTVADSRPGLSLIAVHHDRKAVAEDFVDSVSGTNGLAGSADTIIVLSRKRQSSEALLQVTGRDVPESEYALRLADGVWVLDGRDLADAAATARRRKDEGDLGETSRKIIDFVKNRPEGVRAKDVTEMFGDNSRVYLGRLTEHGHLDKLGRGLYIVPPAED